MSKFKEYVRSSSFRLDLSERQIVALLALAERGVEDERGIIAPYHALGRRGLVDWNSGEGCTLTAAGRLVVQMLCLAGFSNMSPSEEMTKQEFVAYFHENFSGYFSEMSTPRLAIDGMASKLYDSGCRVVK